MEGDKIGKTLKSINVSMEKQVNKTLKKMDLSLTQGLALIWLDESQEKELPIKFLEKMFGTAQSTTLGVVNRLEQKKLVSTEITQQRTKIVKITEEGLGIVEFIRQCAGEADELFFKDFTIGEKILFLELLQKAEQNILRNNDITTGDEL
ncbi:MAG: hypothetical protein R3Y54_01075 [Eubacteriales bacterium]